MAPLALEDLPNDTDLPANIEDWNDAFEGAPVEWGILNFDGELLDYFQRFKREQVARQLVAQEPAPAPGTPGEEPPATPTSPHAAEGQIGSPLAPGSPSGAAPSPPFPGSNPFDARSSPMREDSPSRSPVDDDDRPMDTEDADLGNVIPVPIEDVQRKPPKPRRQAKATNRVPDDSDEDEEANKRKLSESEGSDSEYEHSMEDVPSGAQPKTTSRRTRSVSTRTKAKPKSAEFVDDDDDDDDDDWEGAETPSPVENRGSQRKIFRPEDLPAGSTFIRVPRVTPQATATKGRARGKGKAAEKATTQPAETTAGKRVAKKAEKAAEKAAKEAVAAKKKAAAKDLGKKRQRRPSSQKTPSAKASVKWDLANKERFCDRCLERNIPCMRVSGSLVRACQACNSSKTRCFRQKAIVGEVVEAIGESSALIMDKLELESGERERLEEAIHGLEKRFEDLERETLRAQRKMGRKIDLLLRAAGKDGYESSEDDEGDESEGSGADEDHADEQEEEVEEVEDRRPTKRQRK